MTILLSSNGGFATQTIKNLVKKPLSQIKIAWLITASNVVDDKEYLKWRKNQFAELKLDIEEIDIENMAQTELEKSLNDKDVLFVEGGNTFYLLKSIKETGFDIEIKKFIDKGGVYIGSSAGSYIMCPTVEMATWKKEHVWPRFGLTDFTGLNYVPFLVFAHYLPKHKEVLKEKIAQSKYPVRILQDGQGILIKDNKTEFIGEGKEIVI